jgi:hypothetical protein
MKLQAEFCSYEGCPGVMVGQLHMVILRRDLSLCEPARTAMDSSNGLNGSKCNRPGAKYRLVVEAPQALPLPELWTDKFIPTRDAVLRIANGRDDSESGGEVVGLRLSGPSDCGAIRSERTVMDWQYRAGAHAQAIHEAHIQRLDLHCQDRGKIPQNNRDKIPQDKRSRVG